MKKMKRAIYLFVILFILCGCTQKVHVKTISENREITKEQKTKNKNSRSFFSTRENLPDKTDKALSLCLSTPHP